MPRKNVIGIQHVKISDKFEKKEIEQLIEKFLYNLDMIISLEYRIKSKIATNFRRGATERLKEYKALPWTIKDIRSSEKVLYRQVLNLYATAVDYDSKDSKSIEFFKIVRNKLYYAAHGHTAPEVIYEKAKDEYKK